MDAPVTHAHVERIDDDLLVTWRGAAGVDDVAVFVSESPDDAGTVVTAPDRPGAITLRGLDPTKRFYVHLLAGDGPFVVTAERSVPLEGAKNFRDIGGYRGLHGHAVRWGRVFRSDHLAELTDADLDAIRALGVQTIIDYRGPVEHEHMPSRIPLDGPIDRRDLAIGDGTVEGVSLWDAIISGSLPAFGTAELTEFYLATLDRSAPIFGEVLGLIAEADRHALVFHCTAGKDRTGLTAALLLSVLGVADAEVLDDYELTNRFRSAIRVEELRPTLAENGIDIDNFVSLFTAPRRALADTLVAVRSTYGSIDGYLVDHAGVRPETLDELRAHLLTP